MSRFGSSFVSRSYRRVLQVIVSAVLLGLLWNRAGIHETMRGVALADPCLLILGGGCHFIALLLGNFKWWLLLARLGHPLSLVRLSALYLASVFWSTFLPTTIGGDAVRVVIVGRAVGNSSAVILATIVERASGLAALLALAVASGAWGQFQFNGIVPSFFPLAGAVSLVVILAAGLFHRRLRRYVYELENSWNQIRRITTIPTITWVLALSFAKALFYCLEYWMVARSLHLQLPFNLLLAIVPSIALMRMLPVTLNGIGIGESVLYVVLSALGFPGPTLVSFGLLVLVLQTVIAAIGGIFAISCNFSRDSWRR
jgi:uncharacterized membrane protein YbhN (UPF0104 family)